MAALPPMTKILLKVHGAKKVQRQLRKIERRLRHIIKLQVKVGVIKPRTKGGVV